MVTKGRIGLSLATLKGGHDVRHVTAKIKAAARAGFNGVGIDVADIEGWLASGRHLRELLALVKDLGMEVYEVGEVSICDSHGAVRDQVRAFAHAAALGAPVVSAVYENGKAQLSKAREDWAKFMDLHSDVDEVSAALHFKGESRSCSSLNVAWEIIAEGPSNGGLVLDLYDFWRGHSAASTLDAIPIDLIRMVHLTDVENVPREDATCQNRTCPGRGIMPLTHIVSTLGRRAYAGPICAEVMGECQKRPCAAAAGMIFRATRKLLGTSGPSHRKLPVHVRDVTMA